MLLNIYIIYHIFCNLYKKLYEVTVLFLQRRKYKRRTRTEASVLSTRTVKRRLASALGIKKPKVPLQVPTMKNNTSVPEKSALINARYSAGIPQVSLFGNNLGFTYSPPGWAIDPIYSLLCALSSIRQSVCEILLLHS